MLHEQMEVARGRYFAEELVVFFYLPFFLANQAYQHYILLINKFNTNLCVLLLMIICHLFCMEKAKIVVLGSAASTPTKDRNLSSVALKYMGNWLKFDCPE